MSLYRITLNGKSYEVLVEELEQGGASTSPVSAPASFAAPRAEVVAPAAAAVALPAVSAPGRMVAPMPGKIVDIAVAVGQTVKAGDVVCVIEAMKMENDVRAKTGGKVASIAVSKGAVVASGELLVTFS